MPCLTGQLFDVLLAICHREQFCISSATREYTKLVSALPEEWVGSRHRIKPLVKLLCQQMALAFDSAQAACPPWRQQKSIISKWLPAKVSTCSALPSVAPSTGLHAAWQHALHVRAMLATHRL